MVATRFREVPAVTEQLEVEVIVGELRHALELLDAVIQVRLEERRGGPEHRQLSLDGDGEGIPDLERYDGVGPLAAAIGMAELSAAEALILVAAIAPLVDERFDALYAQLTDREGVVGLTGEVARTLVARSFSARLDAAALLGPLGALRASGLLVLDPEDSLTGRLTPEPALAAWVLGLPIAERRATSDFPARPLTTVHTMADVVLAPRTRARLAQLQDRVRLRGRVVDEWGFGRHHDNSSGLVALFHGPPGTGKTMTAGAIAGAAGLPAYMIDLSALVSKYIGETEKALAKVFDRAAREQCVLVFDEADAVFGTRTEVSDAHDRYANQEVSYLLTRVESHPGVVILTTNLVGNIDEAFRRRIHIDVEFSAPGPTERAAIWTAALPPALPTSGDLGLEDLADRFAITGAQIRDAIIDAAYAAAARDEAVTRDHLVAAVRQQYDKAGRTVPA
jgi:hypothetical protein